MNENNTQNEIPNVNSKGKEERNVPDLRYKEFADDWIISNISNEFILLTNNSLSRDDLNYDCGYRKNIHYGDILTKYTTVKNIIDNDVPYINDNIKISSCSVKLISGDIIIADTAEDYAVGKAIEIFNPNSFEIYSGLHTIPLRPKNKFSLGYLAYYFNSYNYKKRIFPLIQGIKVYSLSKTALSSSIIKFPTLEEQEKIAQILIKIDTRISTQKKIICLLESQINQIRNTLINTIEKQHSFILFGDIIEEYKEKTTANNMYPVLSSTKSGIHLQSEYFNKEAASDDTTGYKIIPRGYCAYRSMSDTGEFTFNVQNIIETGIVSPAYPVFTTKYNNEFIIEYLNNSTKLRNNILSLKEGGTRFALSLKKLMTLEIPKISIDEQKNFIDLVNKFNNKIKNEKQILSLYEKQKQYLLDKLFI